METCCQILNEAVVSPRSPSPLHLPVRRDEITVTHIWICHCVLQTEAKERTLSHARFSHIVNFISKGVVSKCKLRCGSERKPSAPCPGDGPEAAGSVLVGVGDEGLSGLLCLRSRPVAWGLAWSAFSFSWDWSSHYFCCLCFFFSCN